MTAAWMTTRPPDASDIEGTQIRPMKDTETLDGVENSDE